MIRPAIFILITIFTLGIGTGCGRDSEEQPPFQQTAAGRTVTDMTGRQVAVPLPGEIGRVAVQTSPQVLNMYAVGVPEKLCAVTRAVKRWPLLGKADPRLAEIPATRAGNAQINIEALLAARPDICIGSESDMRAIEALTDLRTLRISMGVPGAYFQSVRREVEFFGGVFGKEARAKMFADRLESALAMIRQKTAGIPMKKRVKVYMGFDADHLTTYGGDTFMDEWIEAAGCTNAAGSIESLGGKEGGLRSVSIEQLLAWNPDIVIIDSGTPKALCEQQAWSGIKAVRDRNVYRLPIGLFLWNRPACEAAVLFPQWLAASAYPEEFRLFDIRHYAKEFYRDIFGFEFTGSEIDHIFKPQAGENVPERHT